VIGENASMNLGTDAWNKRSWYYGGLTLAINGDDNEREAFSQSPFYDHFSSYEKFWRYHVAPATERPNSIRTRHNAASIISMIAQRSFSTFQKILEAVEQLRRIENEGLGVRFRNATSALECAGVALTLFGSLERLIAGQQDRNGKLSDCLATTISEKIVPPRDRAPIWDIARNNLIVYRDYLTHQGALMTVKSQASDQPLVLRREHLVNKGNVDWAEVEREHLSHSTHWEELRMVCGEVVRDTLNLLNLGYNAFSQQMDALVETEAYQRLWGWEPGMEDIIDITVNSEMSGGSGGGVTTIWQPVAGSSTSTDITQAWQQIHAAQRSSYGDLW
jgi:hypothetical protein